MKRLPRVPIVSVLLAAAAFAQSTVDGNHLRQAPTPVKHAGTVDVVSGRWSLPRSTSRSLAHAYDNTCFFDAGTGYVSYVTSEACEELYDEGEIPASDNHLWQSASTAAGGSGGGAANLEYISGLELAYCTANAGADIELALWERLNGDCVGFVPPTGGGLGHWSKVHGTPGGGTNAPRAYFDLSGLGLPGSSSPGASSACWIVAISNFCFPIASDGDGTFDNIPANDKFVWAVRNNDVPAGGLPHGWLVAGDPIAIPPGSCTYDIPCMTDWTGGVCGSGYGSWDGWWQNSDGGVAGGCSPAALASGCYFLGGYPSAPFASFFLRMELELDGVAHLCRSRPSSIPGCRPTLSSSSLVVVKGAGGPVGVWCLPVPGGNAPGMLIFGKSLVSTPIQTRYGQLCLQGFFRAPITVTTPGGTAGTCSGTYVFDLQALVNHAPDTQAAPGDFLYVQAWYRDQPNPDGANLSNALGSFVIL